MNIYDLISRAQKLRKETQPDSVSPDRVGGLHEDTLKYIAEIGAVPADAELSATSTNPPQNKVVTKKFTKLESEVTNIKDMVESGAGGSGGIYLLKFLEYPNTSGLSEEDKTNNIQIYNAVRNGTLDRPIATYKDGIYVFFSYMSDYDDGSLILSADSHFTSPLEEDMAASRSSLYETIELKENGEAFVTSVRMENVSDSESGNEEGTEVLTLYAFSALWELSPSMFEIPDGEELPEEQIEMMELVLALFANNASVYNKIMSSDASAKSYSVVIDYMLDYIYGMACRAIVPAVLVKSFDSFRIIQSDEYVSYTLPTELPDLGYTISEDGGYSRKSAMIMFAIVDTGVIPESLVQQNARVAKLLINKQVDISNIYIFLGTSSQFNSLAEEAPLTGMSVVQLLMEYNAKYNSSSGRIMNSNLDSWGNVGGSTNEIHFSIPGAIAKFDPYSSSPTITEVVDFTKINN